MKHAIRHIHFVGIGGAGMSGIAEVLLNQGYTISGSDLAMGAAAQRLADLGARVHLGHAESHIEGADCLVTSTAVKADNPEVVAAHAKLLPVVPRAVMLAELMRKQKGVAIAGTHGKTTTTSLVTSVLAAGNLDPTFVIGGRLNSAGANARLGSGEYIVVEADESDASFLNLLPVLSVVTNIDADHMDTYGHDFGRLKQAFVEFLHRMPFYGAAVVCVDDPAIRSLLPEIARPITSYGFAEDAQVRAIDVRAIGTQMHFTAQRRNGVTLPDLEVVLNLPGRHNVLNALAAIAVAVELGVPDEAVQRGLAEFHGVGRRFQSYGQVAVPAAHGGGHFTVVDDYGHHPVEMAATLAAARGAFPGQRLVLAFQPHRYTRTRDCFEDFVKVINQADAVLLAEVYAAGEAPIVAADGRSLARAVRVAGQIEPVFVDDVSAMAQAVLHMARDGDVVLCMGAGSIGAVAAEVVALGASEVARLQEATA
ncbi:MAG: UDP-N-acetylmuramate--L-alanine ligase [Burkholderiaceae bacterium]|nr:UDP-N-acetylmuramate--L-alanine ligase [Burkholderiaceae bacterium]MDZ4163293.1 UDP-N-acetylmuramate--L-alanine ligase [Burkholderiales bacterium]